MSGRTPDLTGSLLLIVRLSRTETLGPRTVKPDTSRQQWQVMYDLTPLEKRPGVDVDKIQPR